MKNYKQQVKEFRSPEAWKGISSFTKDLIEAEEAFLMAMGWEFVSVNGLSSFWSNSEYTIQYSRNQAILLEKGNRSHHLSLT